MMRMNWTLGFLVLTITVIGYPAFAQQRLAGSNLYIDADGRLGQGYTFWRGEDCFAVTADHVVRDNSIDPPVQAGSIELTGPRGVRGKAEFDRAALIDLALLRVTRNARQLCRPEARGMFRGRSGHVVVRRRATGDLDLIDVRVRRRYADGDRMQIAADRDDIQTGLSGSSVFLDGERVGMIIDVDGDKGTATVYTMALINRQFGGFLREPSPEDDPGEDDEPEPPTIDLLGRWQGTYRDQQGFNHRFFLSLVRLETGPNAGWVVYEGARPCSMDLTSNGRRGNSFLFTTTARSVVDIRTLPTVEGRTISFCRPNARPIGSGTMRYVLEVRGGRPVMKHFSGGILLFETPLRRY